MTRCATTAVLALVTLAAVAKAGGPPTTAPTDPGTTLQLIFDLLKNGEVGLATSYVIASKDRDAAKALTRTAERIKIHGSLEFLEQKVDGDIAFVVMKAPRGKGNWEFEAGPMARRDGQWKVVMDRDGLQELFPDKKKQAQKLEEWGDKRRSELREAASSATTAP